MLIELNENELQMLRLSLQADAATWARAATVGAAERTPEHRECQALADEHAALLRKLREAH